MLKELTVKERWKFSKEYTSPYLANMQYGRPNKLQIPAC